MGKRAYGTGTVTQRGPGRWLVQVSGGIDPMTGRRIRLSRVVRGTKRDAEKELQRLLAQLGQGDAATAPARLSLGSWLAEWLEGADYRPKTAYNTSWLIRRYIVPHVGNLPLRDLQALHMKRLYDLLLREGLSPSTVAKVHRVLSTALGQAVRLGLIPRNPAELVEAPRERRIERAPTMEQVEMLLELARGTPYWLPLVVIANTGMRLGECLGLKWDDIDWAGSQIWVRRTLVDAGGRVVEQPPKTRSGVRAIYIYPEIRPILDWLRDHRQRQDEWRQDPRWVEMGYVFTSRFGRPLHRSRFYAAFGKWKRQVGLDWVRPHDLRHAHATALLGAGVPVQVVTERLGHANPGVTTTVYAHLLPGLQRRVLDQVQIGIRLATTGDDDRPGGQA